MKNEPALRDIGSASSSTIDFAARTASTAAPPVGQLGRVSAVRIEVTDEVAVGRWLGRLRGGERQTEPHVGDHHPVEPFALEATRPVAEPALLGSPLGKRRRRRFERAHRLDHVADLLAVGGDVLHRRGAHGAGDAAQQLDARRPQLDRRLDELVPRNAGIDGELDRVGADRRPIRPPSTCTTVPGNPASLTTMFEPPPSTNTPPVVVLAATSAATSSSRRPTRTKCSAGPPTRSVVHVARSVTSRSLARRPRRPQ